MSLRFFCKQKFRSGHVKLQNSLSVAEIVNSTSTSSVYYLLYHILLLCPASIIDVPSDVVTRLKKVETNTGKRKSDCAEVDLVSQRSFDAGQTLGINARFLQANWRRQPTGGDDFRTTFVNQFTKSVLRNNFRGGHPGGSDRPTRARHGEMDRKTRTGNGANQPGTAHFLERDEYGLEIWKPAPARHGTRHRHGKRTGTARREPPAPARL
ncbi:hypothetical protein POM88_003252 [Heracleum sosnowskyi]|uniref:Uncharacterized protein n=1 Tax=Heracleum sosnowskyi TaxID=360622 RepID=A0AAD8JJH3_9APIA|nr:hypothetical protein POM88_003252 [Heracleum sosnowskyi]